MTPSGGEPQLDRKKSGGAEISSRSQMFFTRRGACPPRGKVIWQKRARRRSWTERKAEAARPSAIRVARPAKRLEPRKAWFCVGGVTGA
ncbi:hypothetical protein DI44_11195 [Geobacillus sp. CAMR5420]|nr:hypothetical protein DI44_11195 [Geobacillus sp. CAMR5420]